MMISLSPPPFSGSIYEAPKGSHSLKCVCVRETDRQVC